MRRLAVLALTPFVAACGVESNNYATSTPTTYVSSEVVGHELVPGTKIRLTVGGGALDVEAGCNQMSGDLSVEEDKLLVSSFVSTDLACGEARMDQDTWISRFLLRSPVIRKIEHGAVLTGEGATITLVNEEHLRAQTPISLEGTTWVLETILTGSGPEGVASSVPARSTIRLAEGRLELDTGCNTGGGDVTVGADTLTLSPVALTRMACFGEGAELERTVTELLQGEVTFEHDYDVLTLRSPDGEHGLGYRAE